MKLVTVRENNYAGRRRGNSNRSRKALRVEKTVEWRVFAIGLDGAGDALAARKARKQTVVAR
jgi:hypothetical protein